MIRSLNTGVGGIRNFQTSLDVIANNLANLNTVGFKGGRVDFAEALTQTVRPATPDLQTSGSSSIQISNGVNTNSVTTLFTQGAVNQTGKVTDMALAGEGYFILKKGVSESVESDSSSNGGMLYASRAGDFRLDSNGFLVNNAGMRVQGISNYVLQPNEIGDLKFDRGDFMASIDTDPRSNKANHVTTKKDHGFKTGNQVSVVFNGDKGVGKLDQAMTYFVRVTDSRELKFYDNLFDASVVNAADDKAIEIPENVNVDMRIVKRLESFEGVEIENVNNEQTITSTVPHGFKDGDNVRFLMNKVVSLDMGVDIEGNPIASKPLTGQKDDSRFSRNFFVSLKGDKTFSLHSSAEDAALRVRPVEFDKATIEKSAIAKVASTTTADIQNISVDTIGRINIMLTDGTQYTRGQVMLQKFTNEQALSKEGGNIYGNLENAGESGWGAAGSDGFGIIESGALELSNVDVARQFSKLITTQRAFQANSRMVSASDEILMELLRLKR